MPDGAIGNRQITVVPWSCAGLDAHAAAMQLDEALDDRQAEAGAAPAAAIGARLEAAEHRVEHLRRHAGAVVMHGEFDAGLQLRGRRA